MIIISRKSIQLTEGLRYNYFITCWTTLLSASIRVYL